MGEEVKQGAFDDSPLQAIAKMIEDIKYGSVNIIIQDGKIVQVDKTEKYRVKN